MDRPLPLIRPSRQTRRRFLRGAATTGLGLVVAPYVFTRSKLRADDAAKAPEPDADGYVSLFDGETLTGWHKNPQPIGHGTGGLWTVEDGAICGEQDPPASGNGGILLTDQKFGDFELLLDMKPDWGPDSGLFIRSNDQGQCIQMMVDYHEDGSVGHLYGEGTGGWSARPFDLNGTYDDGEAAGEGDDKRIVNLETTGKKIGIRADIDASKPFGFASYQTRAALRDIRLKEVEGPEVEKK